MLEILSVYFIGLILYPIAIGAYAIESGAYILYGIWLILGYVFWWTFSKYTLQKYRVFPISVWFLPSTLICGAAAVIPWPVAVIWYLAGAQGCISIVSLATTFLLNMILALSVLKLWRVFREKRANA